MVVSLSLDNRDKKMCVRVCVCMCVEEFEWERVWNYYLNFCLFFLSYSLWKMHQLCFANSHLIQ